MRFTERWIRAQYPTLDESEDGEERNRKLHVNVDTLRAYRDRFLLPDNGEGFREPTEGPLESYLAPSIEAAHNRALFEIDRLEVLAHAAELDYIACLKQDEEMGMKQEITLAAREAAMNAYLALTREKSRLGYAGYEDVGKRLTIDQTVDQRTLQVNAEVGRIREPKDRETYEIADAVLKLGTDERERLLALPGMPSKEEIVAAIGEPSVLPPLGDVIEGTAREGVESRATKGEHEADADHPGSDRGQAEVEES